MLVVAVPEIEIETSDALDKTWIVPRQPCAFDVEVLPVLKLFG